MENTEKNAKKEETNEKIDCSQPHHLRTRNIKRARITLGWGWDLQAKRARSPSVKSSVLASSSPAILSARSTVEKNTRK